MLTNDPLSGSSSDQPPLVEVWLDIGEALRLGSSILRVLDTDGQDTMLRVDPASPEDDGETRWSELPR